MNSSSSNSNSSSSSSSRSSSSSSSNIQFQSSALFNAFLCSENGVGANPVNKRDGHT